MNKKKPAKAHKELYEKPEIIYETTIETLAGGCNELASPACSTPA